MRKTLFTLGLLLTLTYVAVQAQQLPLYSQYLANDFFINPAIAGSKPYSPIVLSVHKQWIAIDQSPSTQTISGHTLLANNNVGIGAIIFNDKFGPESHTGIQAVYSYHINLNKKSKLSFGLSAIAFQYKMDQRQFSLTTLDDPTVSYMIEKCIVPDATIGIYTYGRYHWVGITAAHLFQSKLKITNNYDANKMVRHYFVMGGYKFNISTARSLELEPSSLIKFTESTPPQFDINLKLYYNKDYWFGTSIRPNDCFVASVGFRYKQFYFGYSYDFTFSNLTDYTIGSQELVVGFEIKNKNFNSRSSF